MIETFHYPGYVIRSKKEQKTKAKINKIEICTRTVSQPVKH